MGGDRYSRLLWAVELSYCGLCLSCVHVAGVGTPASICCGREHAATKQGICRCCLVTSMLLPCQTGLLLCHHCPVLVLCCVILRCLLVHRT